MALRICDITMFYPTSQPGGVKSYILAKKAHCLQHTDHVHASIVPAAQPAHTVIDNRDHLYEIASPALPWNPTYRLLCSYRRIKQALLDFQPDVIEIGCPYIVPWIVRRIYRKRQAARPLLIGFYHADFPQNDIYRLLHRWSPHLARRCMRLAQRYAAAVYNRLDLCLVSSLKMQERLAQIGVQRIAVVPFGVNTEVFQPLSAPPPADSTLHLLFVGRLSTDKGILPFISLMHRLVADGCNVDLTIVGGGFLEKSARRLAKQAPYIRFHPPVSDKTELARIYSSHDLLIVPNPHETFCLSALEAMACGTPVAALHGLGGIETIINDATGFLLGNSLENFLPALRSLSRQQLLQMRPGVRAWVTSHFTHTQRFNHLINAYAEARQAQLSNLVEVPA